MPLVCGHLPQMHPTQRVLYVVSFGKGPCPTPPISPLRRIHQRAVASRLPVAGSHASAFSIKETLQRPCSHPAPLCPVSACATFEGASDATWSPDNRPNPHLCFQHARDLAHTLLMLSLMRCCARSCNTHMHTHLDSQELDSSLLHSSAAYHSPSYPPLYLTLHQMT